MQEVETDAQDPVSEKPADHKDTAYAAQLHFDHPPQPLYSFRQLYAGDFSPLGSGHTSLHPSDLAGPGC